MPATIRRDHRSRKSLAALLSGIAAVGLCAFQFGDRNDLNKMPFSEVRPLAFDLAKARRLAKQGNIDLQVGETEPGESVRLRGEVTDANCYLGSHIHAYDHAFCAKLCAAAGGPLVFVPDQGGQVYLVLSQQNAKPLPEDVLDRIGVPGIVVKARMFEANGIHALAVEGLAP
jgi:hypothetical protein